MIRPPLVPAILYEDNHLLVVNKPAGLPTQNDETGDPSLVDWATADLKHRYAKPGNVFVGLVHRLDRPVSGVVLLAKTSKAASRLSDQFRRGAIHKTYWAIVEGQLHPPRAVWTDSLLKDSTRNISRIAPNHPEAREAIVEVQLIEERPGLSWVELHPRTGRSHQLRVQLAGHGHPILGDRRYGSTRECPAADGGRRIALHARAVTLEHPTRKEPLTIEAPLPPDWPADMNKS